MILEPDFDRITFETFKDEHIPQIVRFWNDCFSGMRNFFPVSSRDVRDRIVRKGNAVEKFDPSRFFIARDEDLVVGIAHAALRSEEVMRAIYPDWESGSQGYLAIFGVLPQFRKIGVGGKLLQLALATLDGAKEIVLDGQCINPWYGNSEAPFTPFFGTPEGVSIPADDAESLAFLARRGFRPRYDAVALELDMTNYKGNPQLAVQGLTDKDYKIVHCANHCPMIGGTVADWKIFRPGFFFDTICALENDVVVGTITGYQMIDLDPSKYAIYEFEVDPEHHGKGYGRALLTMFLSFMKDQKGARVIETLTIPEVSGPAFELYKKFGFVPAQTWAIF
ncbi:MAG: GNAT family N-acetyltransferase [Planctomycetes bacterium]|nr:GNAT family N-acetyltransferase [Planctomycetota bacterium]